MLESIQYTIINFKNCEEIKAYLMVFTIERKLVFIKFGKMKLYALVG